MGVFKDCLVVCLFSWCSSPEATACSFSPFRFFFYRSLLVPFVLRMMTAPGTSGASSSAVSPEIRAALDAQKDAILAAVNTQIQGLQSNLLAAQSDLASQIASEVQPDSFIFKKKENEQQFKFNQKVFKNERGSYKSLGRLIYLEGKGGTERRYFFD